MSAAALPELLIPAAVIVVVGITWLSCIAEQNGRHTLPVVLTWAACLLAALSAIWSLRREVNAYVYFESGQALSGALDDTPALPGGMRVAIMRDEKPSDELVDWMTDVLNNCHRAGMILPYIVSSISPNGSVIVVRMDGENVDVLAEHYEDGAFRLPMTIAVIDQKNEAVLVRVGENRDLTYRKKT